MDQPKRVLWFIFAYHLQKRDRRFMTVKRADQSLTIDCQFALDLAMLEAGSSFEGYTFIAVASMDNDTDESFGERVKSVLAPALWPGESPEAFLASFRASACSYLEEVDWEEGIADGRYSSMQ
jgi:hypothetical protein